MPDALLLVRMAVNDGGRVDPDRILARPPESHARAITVHAEVPSDDVIRTFYEVPDSLAMLLWGDKSTTTFCEALGDLLAEARELRR